MAERVARLASFSVVLFGVVLLVGAGWIAGIKPDADAYWLAAQRLRDGLPLYAASYGDEIEIYRYAPWFAYAWVPLTYLPKEAAFLIWRALLLGGALGAAVPLLKLRTPAALSLGILALGLLVSNLPAANVTALIVGALTLALPGRWGPVALGLAGSLKGFPLLFVAGYIAERRWRDALVTLVVAGVLWLHALAFDVSSYPTAFGGVSLYRVAPLVWPLVVALTVAVIALLAWRRSPWTWLAIAAALPLVVPRIWLPDAAYFAPAAVMVLRGFERRSLTPTSRIGRL